MVCRELDGIPKLVRLLGSDVPDIQKNVCGCLKNLSFGKENDENKVKVLESDVQDKVGFLYMGTAVYKIFFLQIY